VLIFFLSTYGRGFIDQFLKHRKRQLDAKHAAMLEGKRLDLRIAEENSRRASLEIEHFNQRHPAPKAIDMSKE